MIVARQTFRVRDVLILHRRFEDGTAVISADQVALDFLPWRLRRWICVTASGHERLATLREFFLGHQHVGATGLEIDANMIAALQQCEITPRGGLWCSIQNRG